MKIFNSVSEEKNLFLKVSNILLPNVSKDKILIYDIDTTALEPANGCVFLIGTVYFDGNDLKITQFFSEDIKDEPIIINEFLNLSKNFEVLLSYKGDSFDIPFLTGRIGILSNDHDDLSDTSYLRKISYDLFDEIRPLKPALKLSSTRLDILRKLTGQSFTERITADKISTFYVQHISRAKLRLLKEKTLLSQKTVLIKDYSPCLAIDDDLAHINTDNDDSFLKDILNRNRDNMEAVLYLGKLGHLFNMRKGLYEVSLGTDCVDVSGENTKDISIIIKLDTNTENSDNCLSVKLPVYTLDLKQFFINYRDYYYFPERDMAIHKSVAEFTDKSSRKKATQQTAYSKVSGDFIKIPSAFVKAQNKKEGCLYKESFESEDYYLPLKSIHNIGEESLKALSFYCVLEKIDLRSESTAFISTECGTLF